MRALPEPTFTCVQELRVAVFLGLIAFRLDDFLRGFGCVEPREVKQLALDFLRIWKILVNYCGEGVTHMFERREVRANEKKSLDG